MIELAFIRHGPTRWNEQRRLQGRTDLGLSPAGREAVSGWRVPAALRDFAWVASPLARACETADLLGLACTIEPAVIEMDWGAWEGHTLAEIERDFGQSYRELVGRGLDLRPPGGETPREVRARLAAWLARAAPGRPIGAVTHLGVIRAAYSLATGWDMTGKAPVKFDWGTASRFTLAADGTLTIRALNLPLVER